MNDNKTEYTPRNNNSGKIKRSRESVNIQFAQTLEEASLLDIIQNELLRSRAQSPPSQETSLPTTLMHEIKFRLNWYFEKYGAVPEEARDTK